MGVVVTGAAGDPTCSQALSIGAAVAIELATSCDAMWLIDRNGPGLEWTKEQLPSVRGVSLVECDLREPVQLQAALTEAINDPTGVDVVVSVAGATAVKPFLDHSFASLTDEVTLNLLQHLWLARALLPGMCERGQGSFVCIGSDSAKVGAEGLVGYTTAKGGLMSFVRSLARELGPHGVRVNCVSPGPTRTPSRTRLAHDDVPTGFRNLPPLGRLGEPEDIAAAIAFLVSERGAFITGQTLSVNGGMVTT
jgi:2-hydroxycyclohexanecarboxyl-CoA dehydrogenase